MVGRRLVREHAGRWYLAALLPAPLLLGTVLLALSTMLGDAYRPRFLWVGLAFGLTAGLVEEVGWTGVATPALRLRFGVWRTGVVLGIVWGVWHVVPTVLLFDGVVTGTWAATLIVQWVVTLTAYRVLIVWLHECSGSLLLAGLMHASYTAAAFVLEPAAAGAQALTWKAAFASVVVCAAVALFIRQRAGAPSRPWDVAVAYAVEGRRD